MTWRELAALRAQWRLAREYQIAGFAGLQATLHNHWWKRSDNRKWLPSDFMPGNASAADDRTTAERVEDQKLAILSALQMAAACNGVN